MADSPYPELKKTHTPAHNGTPWRDYKPPPSAPVWAIIQGLPNYSILVAAIELGVFDALAASGPATAEQVSAQLHCSSAHLQSLLDSLVVLGFVDAGFVEAGPGRYELSETAERYLTSAGAASMVELVDVAPGSRANWIALADTVRHGRVQDPIEGDPAAFYRPLVSATFPTQRRVATFTARMIGFARWSGAPHVLDLGAGAAPWTVALLEANTRATAVVNDLGSVLDLAQAKTAEVGVADRCTFRPGDFFDISIESGAYDVVVLGHVTRTEGSEGAPQLIDRAFKALRAGGALLLADYFRGDEQARNPFGILMGTTMMANTVRGSTFTNGQYAQWLTTAGFAAIRLIEPIGAQFVFTASKPR
jgi:ubiquinone/menaquinone biosynthesis C-methylase UbiE